jgi:DNA-binding CsgD family transcriptional regulator
LCGTDYRRRGPEQVLVGRAKELDLIRSFLDQSMAGGGTLLLSGAPGVGKTALLAAAAQTASESGTYVLHGAGAEFEAGISFSGLHQILMQLLGEFDQLSSLHRDPLLAALGLAGGTPPDRMLVSHATLALLRHAAAKHPLLMIIDDLPWLDRPSAVVLGFVARRLAGSRVGLLAALRSEEESFFERAALRVCDVAPLADEDAATLISGRFPMLASSVRRRVLAEAAGNPLALLELPNALSGPQRTAVAALPAFLPMSRRLQALFASRVSELPAQTRDLLLIAALDGTGDMGVLQKLAPAPQGIETLAPAERAQLVYVDQTTGRLTFRHPLARSAVVALATSGDRRRAHQALAAHLVDQPERRTLHLAEATVGPDEHVAALLDQMARGTLRRGDAVGAVSALIRAADLSPRGSDRSRRLAEAAYVGADVTGDLREVLRLLDDARRADPEFGGSLHSAVAAAYLLLNGDGDVDTAHRLLVNAITTYATPHDPDDVMLIEALHTLVLVCFFGGRAELWEPFHSAVARLEPRVPKLLDLQAKTFADPVRTAAAALDQLDAAVAALQGEADPVRIVRVGIASYYVDRVADCREPLWRVVRNGRGGGAITSAIDALMLLCNDHFSAGLWDDAERLADEGLALCEAHGYRVLEWPGRCCKALLAAVRGDYMTTEELTDEMSRWAAPRRAFSIEAYSCQARGLAAHGRGDFDAAFHEANAVSPAGTLSSHMPHALPLVMDLVEAAMRTGRKPEAMRHVAAMKDADIGAISPRLGLLTAGSAAMAATGRRAGQLFDEALAIPDAERWPFDLARVRLAYGERLRRDRATAESRTHLIAARATFRRLGAQPWAARAANELRATGLTTSRPALDGPALLTPTEREIASLAAAGMSNKQIGERLFLSHRTVGTHLYQIFPKLGIASRAALRDALGALPSGQIDEQVLTWR